MRVKTKKNDFSILDDIPELYIWIKDENLNFIYVNQKFAETVGFQSAKAALGKNDYDLSSSFSEFAEVFRANDYMVIDTQKTYDFLEVQKSAKSKELMVFYVTKSPYRYKNGKCGVIGYAKDVSKIFTILNDFFITKKTIDRDKKYINKIKLTKREAECLSLILRGKTAKEIGNLLNISGRTIEHYFSSLKEKFNCSTKSMLIETALTYGYFSLIPMSILKKPNSILL